MAFSRGQPSQRRQPRQAPRAGQTGQVHQQLQVHDSKHTPVPEVQPSASPEHLLFWNDLRSEVCRINNYYLSQERECIYKARDLNLRDQDLGRSFCGVCLKDESVRSRVAAYFKESDPNRASTIQAEIQVILRQQPNLHEDSEFIPSIVKFRELCFMLDRLRKFAMDSYIKVLRLLESHDAICERKMNNKKEYMQELMVQPFYSSRTLNSLLTQTECVAAMLLCGHCTGDSDATCTKSSNVLTPEFKCSVCLRTLHNPVVFPCTHRFCACCAHHVLQVTRKCPLCRIELCLRTDTIKVDSVLQQFLDRHVSKPPNSNGSDSAGDDCGWCQPLGLPSDLQSVSSTDWDLDLLKDIAGNLAVGSNSQFSPLLGPDLDFDAGHLGGLNSVDNTPFSSAGSSPPVPQQEVPMPPLSPLLTATPQPRQGVKRAAPSQVSKSSKAAKVAPSSSSSSVPSSHSTAQLSCHQCKLKKSADKFYRCTHTNERGRKCRKKYCEACVQRSYPNHLAKRDAWKCPACDGLCKCARCQRDKSRRSERAKLEAVSTTTESKSGKAMPCHQCKTPQDEMVRCQSITELPKTAGSGSNRRLTIQCGKSYCKECLKKYPEGGFLKHSTDSVWRCPACVHVCKCDFCRCNDNE